MIKKKPRKKNKYYCPECEKYYPHSKCKEELEFSKVGDGTFLESIWVTCPKGHL